MKKIINKLNNFKFTAMVLSGVSLLSGILGLGLLFIYYFAGNVSQKTSSRTPSFANLGIGGKVMGMIFFIFCILVIIMSIVVIYNLLPAARNKEKVNPSKSTLICAVINGGLEVVVLIFSILAITLEKPNTLALYILTIPFTLLTAAANIFCIVPFLKCEFYMPEIKRD